MKKIFKKLSILSWLLFVIVMGACKKENSEPVNFRPPAVFRVIPTNGAVGEVVTVQGQNFSTKPQENEVKLNGLTAEVIEADFNELQVIVPEGATTGKITVTVKGATSRPTLDFLVLSSDEIPQIERFEPESISLPGEVIIYGKNFDPDLKKNQVTFNRNLIEVVSGNTTQLTVIIPDGPDLIDGRLVVSNGLRRVATADFLRIIPKSPEITGIFRTNNTNGQIESLRANDEVNINDEIIIEGKNLITAQTNIRIGTAQVRICGADTEEDGTHRYFASIPVNARTERITLTHRGGSATSSFPISIDASNGWERRPLTLIDKVYHWQVGSKLYTLSGFSEPLREYDLETGRTRILAIFGQGQGGAINPDALEPRLGAATFVYNNNLYLVGGRTNSAVIDVWQFNTNINAWRRKKDFVPVGLEGYSFRDGNITRQVPFRFFYALGFNSNQRAFVGFNGGPLYYDILRQSTTFEDPTVTPILGPEERRNRERRRLWEYAPAPGTDDDFDPASPASIAWREIGSSNDPGIPENVYNDLLVTNINNPVNPAYVGHPSQLVAGSAFINNRIYIRSNVFTQTSGRNIVEFDPESNAWTTKSLNISNLTGNEVSNLVAFGNLLYMTGSETQPNLLPTRCNPGNAINVLTLYSVNFNQGSPTELSIGNGITGLSTLQDANMRNGTSLDIQIVNIGDGITSLLRPLLGLLAAYDQGGNMPAWVVYPGGDIQGSQVYVFKN